MSDDKITKAAVKYANNRRHAGNSLGRDGHREARLGFEAGAEWQAQRQGGDSFARSLQSMPCWACKKPVSINQKRENDGDCPHCGSELDEDLWPHQPAVPESNWTPCKQWLPAVGERYLCLGHAGKQFICWFDGNSWKREPQGKKVFGVTHWMNLPEPPEPKL